MSYSLSPYYSDFTEDELWLNDKIFHSDTLDTDKFIMLLPYFILFICNATTRRSKMLKFSPIKRN